MTVRQRLLFIFLDGVGLGAARKEVNPFALADTPGLDALLGQQLTEQLSHLDQSGLVFRALDATLGVEGLPQSATGQTSLLTGRNASQAMGGHYGPWPGPTLRRLLDQGNLFSRAVAAGRSATIANFYPPGYFRALEAGRNRTNAPVHAALGASLRLRDLADFERSQAISADLSGQHLSSIAPGARRLTPARSGAELRQLALQHDFTFFDYWPSDQVGHRGSLDEAVRLVQALDEFLGVVLPDAGDGLTVLLTSDHGNLEDKSIRTHTRAKVPLIVTGPRASDFASAGDLTHVAPLAARLLGI